MSFEKYKSIAGSMDWLCAASSDLPRPTRGDGTRALHAYLRGRQVCEEVSFYLRTCIPSCNLEFHMPGLFGIEDIDHVSAEGRLRHCKHGFLTIGHYADDLFVNLLDLKNGFVYVQDSGCYLDGDRIRKVLESATEPDEILVSHSLRFYVDLESFLKETVKEVGDSVMYMLWDSVLSSSEPILGEKFLSEEERVSDFIKGLRTPVDATLFSGVGGRSLLETAKECNKSLLVEILEEYWRDPARFREGPRTA